MTVNFEVRSANAEFRMDDDQIKVQGYAAVFNQETNIGDWFIEVFERGAFKNAIKDDDIAFLVNHTGLPLARSKSGTLVLSEDDHGLNIESDLDPSDPDVMQIVPKMKRGDLDKMSIAFRATKETWDDTGEIPKRIVHEAELLDVSIVTKPAYDGTEIGLRSLEKHRKNSDKSKNFNNAARRLRMKMNLDQTVRRTAE